MQKQQTVRDEILDQLSDLSSEQFQREEWVESTGTWFSPEEIAERWIDDVMHKNPQWLISSGDLSIHELEILLPVDKAIRDFIDTYRLQDGLLSGDDLLVFPPLVALRDVAGEALKQLSDLGWKRNSGQ